MSIRPAATLTKTIRTLLIASSWLPTARTQVPNTHFARNLSAATMPNSIPNDIYQYSLQDAYTAGHQTGGPPVAFLTNHGTHGIGYFQNGASDMIQIDSTAYSLSKDGSAAKAGQEMQLPFVKVCVFQPSFRTRVPAGTTLAALRETLQQSASQGKGRNTPMPFSVQGSFKSLETTGGKGFEDVKGVVFGFSIPVWQAGVSGEGLQCCFLSEDRQSGGRVREFETAEGATVEWAKCGRFHLGFPQDEQFEGLSI